MTSYNYHITIYKSFYYRLLDFEFFNEIGFLLYSHIVVCVSVLMCMYSNKAKIWDWPYECELRPEMHRN